MRSTLTLTTTFEGDQPETGDLNTEVVLDGDPVPRSLVIAMHGDAIATLANMQCKIAGLVTTRLTVTEVDDHV